MTRMKVFRKYYLVFASIIILFFFIGMSMNRLIIHLNETATPSMPMTSPLFFAKLVDRLDPMHRPRALQEIQSMNQREYPFKLFIVDHHGTVLYPESASLALDWNQSPKPSRSYELQTLNPTTEILRFQGGAEQYLVVQENRVRRGPPRSRFYFLSSALLVFSVLLGIGFALAILYWSLGKRVKLADSVISQLQSGNLKARFPIRNHDEFGGAMTRFNKMADEIEHLVEKVRQAERSRMVLLQDLAHDLRTPIASLKNLLETIHYKGDAIKPMIREEMFSLALKEVIYFEKLVEDLLVLAQVSEPRYKSEKKPLDLIHLLKEEAENTLLKFNATHTPISFGSSFSEKSVEVIGDELLLKRMIKNALDNAFSFAKSRVVMKVDANPKVLTIVVEDDGPGFSSDALAAFGVRRMTRYLGSGENERLSVGLGSVILKTIVEIHRGSVIAENRLDDAGKIVGARVHLTIGRTQV